MIPERLSLEGFLSYRDRATLDFSTFDLACIVGPNGAGKSSLLDAITWALFGRARHQDEDLIHRTSEKAEVEFIFEYEGVRYRVFRVKHRQRPMKLDLMVWDDRAARWLTLNESRLRDTQAKLEKILHLDYTTFVHASFFLQGRADSFAQASPSQRKEVLARILGLEMWDRYRQVARERLRAAQEHLDYLSVQRETLQQELDRREARERRLREVTQRLQEVARQLEEAEALWQQWLLIRKELEAEQNVVAQLHATWQEALSQVQTLRRRLQTTHEEIQRLEAQTAAMARLQEEAKALEAARARLAHWEALAEQVRALAQERQHLLAELRTREARLQTELKHLQKEAQEIQQRREAKARLQAHQAELEARIARLQAQASQVEALEARRSEIEAALQEAHEALARAQTQEQSLQQWQRSLEAQTEETCPLCGQPLPAEKREALVHHWQEEARSLAQTLQDLQVRIRRLRQEKADVERQLAQARRAQADLARLQGQQRALAERLQEIEARLAAWAAEAEPRLQQLQQDLKTRAFARDLEARLQELQAQETRLGYDPEAHRRAREADARWQQIQDQLRALAQMQGRLQTLKQEARRLETELPTWEARAREREQAYQEAKARLAQRQAGLPQGQDLERRVMHLREQHNHLQTQKRALEAELLLFDRKQAELARIEAEMQAARERISQLQELEQAFGRNGVQALLIEQALPQIEMEANRWLARLTDEEMRIYLRTQRPYKRPRKDRAHKETLDIVVSDRYGERPYETFSGGEAFRINFALRLALARFLAQRAGAPLRFLVIDEGFGSQDDEGRRRLIEAIQAVRGDFAKILVITHLDELKEMFPVRIEVQKTATGSRLRVIRSTIALP